MGRWLLIFPLFLWGCVSFTVEVGGTSHRLAPLCGTRSAQSGLYEYHLDLCRPPRTLHRGDKCTGLLCQFRLFHEELIAVLSSVSSANVTWSYQDPNNPGKGLVRVSANGQSCHGESSPRYTTVLLTCDPNTPPQHAKLSVLNDVLPSCSPPGYQFELASTCGCTGGCSSGNFSRTVLFILLLFSAYMAFGCILNNLRYNKTSWEAIPHLEFWQSCAVKILGAYKYVSGRVREKMSGETYTDVTPAKPRTYEEEAGLLHKDEFD